MAGELAAGKRLCVCESFLLLIYVTDNVGEKHPGPTSNCEGFAEARLQHSPANNQSPSVV